MRFVAEEKEGGMGEEKRRRRRQRERERGRKAGGRGGREGGGEGVNRCTYRLYLQSYTFQTNSLAYRDKYKLSLKNVAQMFCFLEYLNKNIHSSKRE